MICGNCGKKLRSDAEFCDKCGGEAFKACFKEDDVNYSKQKTKKILLFVFMPCIIITMLIAIVSNVLLNDTGVDKSELVPSDNKLMSCSINKSL